MGDQPETSGQLGKLRESISSVIVNRSGIIDTVLTVFLARGHVILEDIPGIGKTMLARSLARSIDGDFKRVQFTPDLLPADLTGTHILNQKEQVFEFREGPIFTQILLADEINRGTPRTQSALLQAMEEEQVTIDRDTYSLTQPFFVIATQNPLEREGAFNLPFSQLDRFMLKTSIGYPLFEEELGMIESRKTEDPLASLSPVVSVAELLSLQKRVRLVHVDRSLSDYLLRLVTATRAHASIVVGASPRAALQCYRFAQAIALMADRDYCTPDDFQDALQRCLPHRLILKKNLPQAGHTERDVLGQILADIDVKA